MIKEFNIGIKGVIKAEGKCLVLQSVRNGKSYWDIPGGRIDDDERIEDTLKRELSEELPTLGKYSIGRLLNAFRLSHDLKDGKGLMLLFYEINADMFNVELSSEHSDFKWVSKNDLRGLLNDPLISIEDGYYKALSIALDA